MFRSDRAHRWDNSVALGGEDMRSRSEVAYDPADDHAISLGRAETEIGGVREADDDQSRRDHNDEPDPPQSSAVRSSFLDPKLTILASQTSA